MSEDLEKPTQVSHVISEITNFTLDLTSLLVRLALHSTHLPAIFSIVTLPIFLLIAMPFSILGGLLMLYKGFKNRDETSLNFFAWFSFKTKIFFTGIKNALKENLQSVGYLIANPGQLPKQFRRWRNRTLTALEEAQTASQYGILAKMVGLLSLGFSGGLGIAIVASSAIPFAIPIVGTVIATLAGAFGLRSAIAAYQSARKNHNLQMHRILHAKNKDDAKDHRQLAMNHLIDKRKAQVGILSATLQIITGPVVLGSFFFFPLIPVAITLSLASLATWAISEKGIEFFYKKFKGIEKTELTISSNVNDNDDNDHPLQKNHLTKRSEPHANLSIEETPEPPTPNSGHNLLFDDPFHAKNPASKPAPTENDKSEQDEDDDDDSEGENSSLHP